MAVNLEQIVDIERYKSVKPLTKEELQAAFAEAKNKIDMSLDVFLDVFPGAQSENYVYPATHMGGWTESFWTGMVWLCYEMTGEEKYKIAAERNLVQFINRIDRGHKLSTHDIGFLYSLSCVAGYKITKNEIYNEYAVKAADHLIVRYKEKGQFIQAWGAIDDPNMYRYIIDCLMNLPLLYYVSGITGDDTYQTIAKNHLNTAMNTIVREDASTYHTFYFDPQTGAPLKGVTHQGYSDDSCWARGQAWAVYGLVLSYMHIKDPEILKLWEKITNYFVNRLPEDFVPYWDLVFTEGSEPRDTSSASIAVCGMLEAARHTEENKKKDYLQIANAILRSLIENYTTKEYPESNGLLTDAMYSRPKGHNSECNIWGDYYYLEAIARLLNPDFTLYW